MKLKVKEIYRQILKCSPLYLYYRKRLLKKQNFNFLLESRINKAIRNVPFYSNYKELLHGEFALEKLPIIRKKDILGKEHLLVSKKYNKTFLRIIETGGSTGYSLQLFRSIRNIIAEIAMGDYIFSQIGKNLKIAILRGQKPQSGIYEIISRKKIILSSYSINQETLDSYIEVLNKYQISCLHAYPSSLIILSRLIKNKYKKANLPFLKGIITSSEIFSKEDKELVKEVFPSVKIIDYYGHNEQTCCAYSINNDNFIFNYNYGYVEFKETGEKLSNGHRIAEIISTSIINQTMPFIRYGTEDYVELDEDSHIISIIGRTSDFVVNKKGNMVPCIVLTRDCSLQNVTNFQYYQDEIGVLIFKVIVNNEFSDKDIQFIKEDLQSSFDNLIDCKVEIVDTIERTLAGKQRRLIQKLDLTQYN